MLELCPRQLKQTRFFKGRLRLLRSEPVPLLPPELLWEVAKHLQNSFQLRTLASLNRTCKVIREVTLSVLYRTVVWGASPRRPWEPTKRWDQRVNPGLKYIKYMILKQCLFSDLQTYAKRPEDTLPLDSFADLFPQLVFIMLTGREEYIGGAFDGESDWEGIWGGFHLHLYSTITPIDLARATVSHPTSQDLDSQRWARFLRQWDAENGNGHSGNDNDGGMLEDRVVNFAYQDEVQGLTLHRHARLVTSEWFPLESLSTPLRGGWIVMPFREPEDDDYLYAPRLDIRHLTRGPSLNETLQSCAWLLQGELFSHLKTYSVAEVDCRLEVVLQLVKTYTTQNPFEFFIELCDDQVDVATFVSMAESVAEFLSSIPDRTKLASEDPGDYAFIHIKAGQPDKDEEFFEFKHRASFTLHIEAATRPPRCYFLMSVNARSHPRDDPARREQVQYDRSYYLGDAPGK